MQASLLPHPVPNGGQAPFRHRYGVQSRWLEAGQVPLLSQIAADWAMVSPIQVAGRQTVPAAYRWQMPLTHAPVIPQDAAP